jgi:hypothetical protein
MNCFYALRKYGLAVVALSIMAVASMDALAADKKAKAVEDWEIWSEKDKVMSSTAAGLHSNVMSNTAYALRNITNNKYLYWKPDGRVTISADDKLAWDDEHKPRTNPKPRFEFWRLPNTGKPRPLKYGDSVAIALPGATLFNGKPSPAFLMYTKQEKGINLGFSTGTGEHWVIEGGPKGEPIKTNTKISLYNISAKDYVIYAEREYGINLRWNGEVNKPRDHRK